jgi:hypothetical protein
MRTESVGGYVYAIGMEGTPLVKIGMAKDVGQRLATLKRGVPLRLLYAVCVEYPGMLEREIHSILQPLRQRGEWFELPHMYYPSLFGVALAAIEPRRLARREEDARRQAKREADARRYHQILTEIHRRHAEEAQRAAEENTRRRQLYVAIDAMCDELRAILNRYEAPNGHREPAAKR